MTRARNISFILIGLLSFSVLRAQDDRTAVSTQGGPQILQIDVLDSYVSWFNSLDDEDIRNYISNEDAFEFLSENIPLFDCPDSILTQTYYYRWWTFRKHLKKTPDGFIFTEFITPVGHASVHNAISCALGHHVYEGRWLHDARYIDSYISFWLEHEQDRENSKFRSFSSWLEDAVYNRFLVNRDTAFIREVFPLLVADYAEWERIRRMESGMFWQHDVKDGMEESISGGRRVKNVRPTINSYMYGNAKALSKMAAVLNADSLIEKFDRKAARLKELTEDNLWNDSASFFEVRREDGAMSGAREAIGFIPWYFQLPDDNKEFADAWRQLTDTSGFRAPWGITTAERRHPEFRSHGVGTCEWDGAVWPFASTQTLKALSNLLTRYRHHSSITKDVFFGELSKYATAHQKNGVPFIGEYQDERTGKWLKGDHARSRYYNHSGFCDLVISDLVGLKARADDVLEIHPLLPEGEWKWFCLDNVRYHDRILTILWDESGEKYGKGKGFRVYADGDEIYRGKRLERVTIRLKL